MKYLLAIALAGCLALTGCSAPDGADTAQVQNESAYTITEAYVYPVQPGTEAWASFESHQEMIDACEVPEETLRQMTTQALLESVLNYPLLGDVLAYDDSEAGFEAMVDSFRGLEEFLSREDAAEVLEDVLGDGQSSDETRVISRGFVAILREQVSAGKKA